MTFQEKLQQDLQQAMRDRAETRLGVIRMMKAALQNKEIESRKPLDDTACWQVLATLVKQRHEAIEQFRRGNRPDLADKEEDEIQVIEGYLPAAPSEAETDQAIAEALAETGVTSLKQMGVVMKAAQAKLAGRRVDGKALSEKVRARLS